MKAWKDVPFELSMAAWRDRGHPQVDLERIQDDMHHRAGRAVAVEAVKNHTKAWDCTCSPWPKAERSILDSTR